MSRTMAPGLGMALLFSGASFQLARPRQAGNLPPPSCLFGVDLSLVLGDLGDVPAALAAGRGLLVAVVAQKRAAVEELLQAGAVLSREVAFVARQGQAVAAAVAVARAQARQQRRVVIVDAAAHHPAAV